MKRIVLALALLMATSTLLAAAPIGNTGVEHVYKGKKKKKPAAKKKKKKSGAKKKKAATKKRAGKKKR